MSLRCNIYDEYFEWMCNLVCQKRFAKEISYRRLLMYLDSTEFRYSIQKDSNRAADGMDLRHRFIYLNDYGENEERALTGPCSVLEMMIALALRCEEFMDDPRVGDRTGQWFWGMITNMELGAMTDDRFDERLVKRAVDTLLDRNYEPDGTGGLFKVRNCDCDLRDVEIWFQLCYYLDTMV